MAKRSRKTPGKGVVPSGLAAKVRDAADDLYAHADAVVIVAVRFSGNGDSDEGCGCTVRRDSESTPWWGALLALGLVAGLRRRRR